MQWINNVFKFLFVCTDIITKLQYTKEKLYNLPFIKKQRQIMSTRYVLVNNQTISTLAHYWNSFRGYSRYTIVWPQHSKKNFLSWGPVKFCPHQRFKTIVWTIYEHKHTLSVAYSGYRKLAYRSVLGSFQSNIMPQLTSHLFFYN